MKICILTHFSLCVRRIKCLLRSQELEKHRQIKNSATVRYNYDISEMAGDELFGFILRVDYMRISVCLNWFSESWMNWHLTNSMEKMEILYNLLK